MLYLLINFFERFLQHMITLLASIAGFASSIVPEIFKIFLDKSEKRHKIDMIDRHITLGEKK